VFRNRSLIRCRCLHFDNDKDVDFEDDADIVPAFTELATSDLRPVEKTARTFFNNIVTLHSKLGEGFDEPEDEIRYFLRGFFRQNLYFFDDNDPYGDAITNYLQIEKEYSITLMHGRCQNTKEIFGLSHATVGQILKFIQDATDSSNCYCDVISICEDNDHDNHIFRITFHEDDR
jgi:hypothetical protein